MIEYLHHHNAQLYLSKQSNQEQCNQEQCNVMFFIQASSTLPLSVLKSFLGDKVQQHGVLHPQIYNMQH